MTSGIESLLAIAGEIASRGLAVGPVRILAEARELRRASGSAAEEEAALRAAMARAAGDIAGLIATQEDAEAAAIMEVQLALLEDDSLTADAFCEIAKGRAAQGAWRAALDAQVGDYEAAEDAYFRARAVDLADLRDRVLRHLLGVETAHEAVPAGAIIIADDLTPSRFLELDWRGHGGLALAGGSPTSHVAVLARARRVPMLVGLGPLAMTDGAIVVLDAETGRLDPAPSAARLREVARRIAAVVARQAEDDSHARAPAVTADGIAISVLVNLEETTQLDTLDPAICDGIGLVRTEFLFRGAAGLPDEEAQYAAYARYVAWAGGRPVTIRTLDAGGDKPVPGLTPEGEANPFLAVRGLRLSLRRPDVFTVQLRALARAAVAGPLEIMVPMVTIPAEFAAVRRMLDEVVAALAAEGVPAARPALGMMVEVPAAAIRIADFDADFYSIGSNDLAQYVMAASRDSAELCALCDPRDPAVLELMDRVAAHGCATGRKVSLCGDLAADPEAVPALLGLGLRILSVPPAAVGAVKAAIAASRVPNHG